MENRYGKEYTIEEAKSFLFNRQNVFNCKECPYANYRPEAEKYSCGQFHCWVDLSAPEDEG